MWAFRVSEIRRPGTPRHSGAVVATCMFALAGAVTSAAQTSSAVHSPSKFAKAIPRVAGDDIPGSSLVAQDAAPEERPDETMMMEMPLIAPLFIQDGQITSVITMVNEVSKKVDASVELFAPDGSSIAQQKVSFEPHSRQVLEISDLLSHSHSTATTGWIKIVPDGKQVHSMAIAAQLSMTARLSGLPSYVEEEFLMHGMHGSATFRAMSSASSEEPVVALVNTSENDQTAHIGCLQQARRSLQRIVDLAPHEMRLVSACGHSAEIRPGVAVVQERAARTPASLRSYGVEVTSQGAPGDVLAYGLALSRRLNQQDVIALNFTDIAAAKSGDTVFTGVPVGRADLLSGETFKPQLSIANFGDQPAGIAVKHAHMDGGTAVSSVVKNLVLPARSTAQVELWPVDGDPDLRDSFIVSSNQAPGIVYSSLVSQGGASYGAVQLIGKDRKQGENGGGHPWTIEEGQQSTLFLFNHSDTSKEFTVNIAAKKARWQKYYTLAANETRHISINALIRSREKDRDGASLPADAMSGEISWFTPNSGEGSGRLLVSSLTGQARNFSCGYNIVLCGVDLYNSYNEFDYLALGFLGPLRPRACTAWNPNSCYGDSYGSGGASSYNWVSTAPGITPVSGYAGSDTVSLYGQDVGSGGGQGTVYNNMCQATAPGGATVMVPVMLTASPTKTPIGVTNDSANILGQLALGTAMPPTSVNVGLTWSYTVLNPNGVGLASPANNADCTAATLTTDPVSGRTAPCTVPVTPQAGLNPNTTSGAVKLTFTAAASSCTVVNGGTCKVDLKGNGATACIQVGSGPACQ